MSRDKETETKLVSEFNERYKQGVKDWHQGLKNKNFYSEQKIRP